MALIALRAIAERSCVSKYCTYNAGLCAMLRLRASLCRSVDVLHANVRPTSVRRGGGILRCRKVIYSDQNFFVVENRGHLHNDRRVGRCMVHFCEDNSDEAPQDV